MHYISDTTAADAFGEAAAAVKLYRISAKAAQKIIDDLAAAPLNIRLDDRLRDFIPGFKGRYIVADGGAKSAFFRDDASKVRFNIPLGKKGDRHIDVEGLKRHVESYKSRADSLSAAMNDFYSNLDMFRNLAPTMNRLERELQTVLNYFNGNYRVF